MSACFTDTLTGKKRPFEPVKKRQISMYTCGPTVYDYAHIGNFRAFVFEDLLRRFLECRYRKEHAKVRHTMNITDVDDKTISGALREGKTLSEFTKKYIEAFTEDLKTLNILPPNFPAQQPRATKEIPEMIKLITRLTQKNLAYVSDGSVYYRVESFTDYGKLSKKQLEKNIKGARVDVDEYDKEEATDFALWKKAKEGEPSWPSPWGKGRPGWHVECSAMSMKYLGETFDIHAGGEDLIFPHHENEIAQSEGATGRPFVNFWLHCKHLLVDGEKMSKSKGNFYTLRDLVKKGCDPMAIRYSLMSVHYRSPLNFTLDGMDETADVIKKLDDCYYQCLGVIGNLLDQESEKKDPYSVSIGELESTFEAMLEALDDDLNISEAMAHLLSGVKKINRALAQTSLDGDYLSKALVFFRRVDKLLGLNVSEESKVPDAVLDHLGQRNRIRRNAEFKRDRKLQKQSDDLRSEIEKLGWSVKDGRPGEPSAVKKKRRTWDQLVQK
jgi:cysteinyl-tRNA synthetase